MEGIKDLDPRLVQRANDSNMAFDFGNAISQKYADNIDEINKMAHLDEQGKEKVLDNIFKLRTIELATQGKALSPYSYGHGPAIINKGQVAKSLDSSVLARVNADAYMRKLRQDELKAIQIQKQKIFVDAIQKADKEGLKEISLDGKSFYKHGKNWSTKEPNQHKR